ncbi:hypothetical protein Plec18167_008578 [Paecilomyces lecythidis]|uniref:37S ribosomal protein S25, mitochondrial n=1 Tax=Paecilomyces lecythidis TaxID=3004212 RepID=A0ABR3WVH3_9EURO
MLRPRRPALRQFLQHSDYAKLREGVLVSFRQISGPAGGQGKDSSSGPSSSAPKRQPHSAAGPRRSDNRAKIAWVPSNAKAPNAEYVRSNRAVDARSLAAPRAGGEPANILRLNRLQKPRNDNRGRRPGPLRFGAAQRGRSAGRDRPRRQRRQSSEEEEGDSARAAQIEEVYRELADKDTPRPVRYDPPKEYDMSLLRDTWPSLPIGNEARSGSILEKVSWISGRYPNGYEPPYELARKLFEGEHVVFSSDAEKEAVMEEVKKLAQERADKLTQRKGDMVEPEDTTFVPIGAEERKAMLDELVTGKYPSLGARAAENPAVAEALRNLQNNGTYQTTGKTDRFMAKFESILAASSRRTKRA